MFRPNCRSIFRLLFEGVERTIDNALNLRDLVLQELVKIIVVCYIKDLIGPKHVAAIINNCGVLYKRHNWAETRSCNYNLIYSKKNVKLYMTILYIFILYFSL